MRIVVTRDVEEFAARAEGFLAQRFERNVLATVLMRIKRGYLPDEPPTFAYGLDGQDSVAAAALRVPPWPLLVTAVADPGDAKILAERWLAEDPSVDAVSAEPATARAVSTAIAAISGRRERLRIDEAMHVLEAVAAVPPPGGGAFRVARRSDRDVLIDWERAFVTEAGLVAAEHAARTVDRRLSAGSQFLWDNAGPVSTAGINPLVAGTARIGPVYTPPEHRGHGYATALVADLSSYALRAGADRCMLFTDLANPTSNRIYARIGYRRCGDWEERAIEP
jgi:predicted GNAT family acetyltransferase